MVSSFSYPQHLARLEFELVGIDHADVCSKANSQFAAIRQAAHLRRSLGHAIDCELDRDFASPQYDFGEQESRIAADRKTRPYGTTDSVRNPGIPRV